MCELVGMLTDVIFHKKGNEAPKGVLLNVLPAHVTST
jgi:hypothetical protein